MTNNLSSEWDIDNLPNRITIFRIILIPVIMACLAINIIDAPWVKNYTYMLGYLAALFFVIAAITDFFDGYFARKHNLTTVFGTFLDPIADKLLIVTSLILLLYLQRINVVIVIILVVREFYMTSLRLLATERDLSVPVSQLGKWKTATQMIGIPFLMAYDTFGVISMPQIGTILIYIASLLSLISAISYSFDLLKKFKAKRKQKNKFKMT